MKVHIRYMKLLAVKHWANDPPDTIAIQKIVRHEFGETPKVGQKFKISEKGKTFTVAEVIIADEGRSDGISAFIDTAISD